MLISRRNIVLSSALTFILPHLEAALAPLMAAPLSYHLRPQKVAPNTYALIGKREFFSKQNGGDIANIAFIDTEEGVILIDTGSSLRYGQALKAKIRELTGKEVIRVYNTHFHPDHCLGNQAFEAEIIAAMPPMIEQLKLHGEAFSDNLYRLLGDWMRGTQVVLPGHAIHQSSEKFGSHRFEMLPMQGHTSSDLAILDHKTGLLFTGDLAFLDRAATTPHADLQQWHKSLADLKRIPHTILLPGHGPVDRNGRALEQTAHYLSWLEKTLRASVRRGDDMLSAAAIQIPEEFQKIAIVKQEFERSIAHIFPHLEEKLLPFINK